MARKSPRSRRRAKAARRLPRRRRARTSPARRGAADPASRRRGTRRGHARRTPRARPAAAGRRHGATATRRPARRHAAPARRPPAFRAPEPGRVAALLAILEREYPGAATALRHENPLQLLVATILSAQCTDERVNMVTPGLFARYPDAAAFAAADPAELEREIHSTGFFRMKARAIRECCADIASMHGGQVPRTLEELTALRGVGRKTANVVLGNAYGVPGIVVDTHVMRLAQRLGLTREKEPVKIEFALMPAIPREKWTLFSHWLILHGRRTCIARKPRCSICPLAPHCPRVGVKASE